MTEPFRHCPECTTSYQTEAELVEAYNRNGPAGAPADLAGSAITFCPSCMHDFPPLAAPAPRRRRRARRRRPDDLHGPVDDQLDLFATLPTERTTTR